MDINRVSFESLANGGDDVTGALVKLDHNIGEIAEALGEAGDGTESLGTRVDAVEQVIDGLGTAASKNVGTGAGTVAAGDDARFSMTGFKNLLINGAYDVWQRGTAIPNTAGSYTADRWISYTVGSSFQMLRFSPQPGATYTRSRYGAEFVITSVAGANNFVSSQQRIENVRLLAGKTVTVSFTAYATTVNKKIGVSLQQNFGTGGSPSTNDSSLPGKSVTLTTVQTRYALTFTVPSIAGKTLGTALNDYTELVFWLDAGSAFNARSGSCGHGSTDMVIYDVQVEIGSAATEFDKRPYGLELQLCQRYFEKSFEPDITPANGLSGATNTAGVAFSNTAIRSRYTFKVPKRALPTVTLYSVAENSFYGNRFCYFNSSWLRVSAASASTVNTESFHVDLSPDSTTVVQNSAYLVSGNWTADAEL